MYQTLKEGRKVGSWREMGGQEKEREKENGSPSKRETGHFWVLQSGALTCVGSLAWWVKMEGRRKKPLGEGSSASWLSAPPTGLARRSADSLLAPESHWSLAATCWQHPPLLPQVVSGASCCLYNPLHQIRGPGKRPLCKALQEFVIYRRETPLGVWTQTPKR